VAQDSRARFYVTTPQQGPEAPFVYESDGRFLQRLGREGEGPGEYEYPGTMLVTRGDTIHVLDQRARRLTVLSPSFEVVRTVPGMPGTGAILQLPNGHYVVNNAHTGHPLRLLDKSGRALRGFGEGSEVMDPYSGWRNGRALALSRRGGFWSAVRLSRHIIEHRTEDGLKTLEIKPQSDWHFPFDQL
jgi:hypothetical protein